MKTPVIIPAYNEAETIGSTLKRLDENTVEPFVIVNGEEGATETVEAAQQYTSEVYISDAQGKLPSIQFALRTLLERDADMVNKPILFLDADSTPVFPKRWHDTMTQAVSGDMSRVAAGLLGYKDGTILDTTLRTGRRIQESAKAKANGNFNGVYGANMAMKFGSEEKLEEILELDHIWPGEDRYMARLLSEENPDRFKQVMDMGSIVLASARFLPSFWYRLRNGAGAAKAVAGDDYQTRRADSVTHYFDDVKGELFAYSDKNDVESGENAASSLEN